MLQHSDAVHTSATFAPHCPVDTPSTAAADVVTDAVEYGVALTKDVDEPLGRDVRVAVLGAVADALGVSDTGKDGEATAE